MCSEEIKSIFGNKVRVRVMGLYREGDSILLLNHSGLNSANELWLPPGGGVDFGVGLEDVLVQEFREELGVDIVPGAFLFMNEFRHDTLHAIELFFEIDQLIGEPIIGRDPEMAEKQILQNYRFWSVSEIQNHNLDCFHPVFQKLRNMDELFAIRGFFKFEKNI
ncbi:ADP-ribose pyrophosphatase YjhB, NUDIX family [Reichenbachiella agariperforans]|uniref:ADP-ribose pyrophosphatase YjhB, NUDIX family n=1 Tax=Reichenbachiella agariperforans TaxID=156994 RepID=A0A1M6SR29_REIAG|nr:NUDIX hydrolase [Reichenbachiella agariperforans]SHK47087.1 ADP-ribose pyrophosphatase YjhB, NUDIX family [Reichenbachiella agariperforans]